MSTTDHGTDEIGQQAPDTIATIARCWRYPDDQLVAALDDGLFGDALSNTPTLDELQQEYTRLFIGPGDHPCPPYESVYRDRGGSEGAVHVHGESTRSVVDWYRQYDLAADSTWNDMPDHVAVELEFAGHLQDSDPEALQEFLDEHPQQWLPAFLTAVENHARLPMYDQLATATRELLASISKSAD